MIAISRSLLTAGAAVMALGIGCGRSPGAPSARQPIASAPTQGSMPPSDESVAAQGSNDVDQTGLQLPQGSTLLYSGAVENVDVFPAQGRLGPHTRVVAGGVGAETGENVYETPLSYRDTVAFYDRLLQGQEGVGQGIDGGLTRRTTQGNTTEWVVMTPDGYRERIDVSRATPTRISIVYGDRAAAVETERMGRANAQPGTSLGRSGVDAGTSH